MTSGVVVVFVESGPQAAVPSRAACPAGPEVSSATGNASRVVVGAAMAKLVVIDGAPPLLDEEITAPVLAAGFVCRR